MKTFFQTSLFLSLLLLSLSTSAQSGTVRGTVYEDSSGETLIGVSVFTDDGTAGTSTDFDGTFELNLPVGTYSLNFSYISYKELKITDVVITEGRVTLLDNVRMYSDSEQLEEVVITAAVTRASEAALMTLKRRSTNLIDGISAAKFKKIGDSNAASAVKRVTGVSVEGGKYVYVRGLGDRYTKTMLNGLDIPGLDPDRNSLQIDIFPTNLISNMMIYKTSLAELPADFTGGVVNIETKEFPEEKIFDVSFSLGFNPSMHLNDNHLTYDGGSTDWLGFDDGTRALPMRAKFQNIPTPFSGASTSDVTDFVSSFSPTLDARPVTSAPDFSLGLSYGDQITVGNNDHKLGYTFSASYKSTRAYYDDVFYGEFQRPVGNDVFELVRATTQTGAMSEENVLLAGLAGIAYKTKHSKHRISLMHLQNGEQRAAEFEILNDSDALGQSGYTASSDNLEYSQRSLTNVLLNGEYYNDDASWKLEWKASPTFSTLSDPDIRKAAYTDVGSGDQQFAAGAGGNPTRIWRDLQEINIVGNIDITREYTLFGEPATLMFGGYQLFKERDYSILSFDLQFTGVQPEWTGNPSEVLTSDNLYPNGSIYYQSGNNDPNPNAYNSTANNTAVYISNSFSPYESLKATVGLRAEQFVQRHTGRDVAFANGGDGNNLIDEEVLNDLDLFPSLNLIQKISDKQNLRFSYSRSIARPSFKELSFAQIIDPISNRIFNGSLFAYDGSWNGELQSTLINNLDLRWEMYMNNGQLISASAFYKTFDNPIELVRIPAAQTSNEFQTRNVGDGELFGIELELRKDFSFVSDQLQKLSFSTNVTIVESFIDMTDLEFESRQAFSKDGEDIDVRRQMAGQSPYIINTGLLYNDPESSFDIGLYYNVMGATLTVVGGGLFPDVYSEPFHSLKLTANKSMGKDGRTSLSFEVDNMLNDVREEFYRGFGAQDRLFTSLNPGFSIGVGLSHKLF